VLRKYTLGTGWDFYEISDTSHHEYFECSLCHTVLLFHTGVVCKTLWYLAQKQGYILQNHQMLLSGICPSCRWWNNFSENN
jgi:Fe2+ or Zn2+ uptake regulation protein